jgi:hypothetical protein
MDKLIKFNRIFKWWNKLKLRRFKKNKSIYIIISIRKKTNEAKSFFSIEVDSW